MRAAPMHGLAGFLAVATIWASTASASPSANDGAGRSDAPTELAQGSGDAPDAEAPDGDAADDGAADTREDAPDEAPGGDADRGGTDEPPAGADDTAGEGPPAPASPLVDDPGSAGRTAESVRATPGSAGKAASEGAPLTRAVDDVLEVYSRPSIGELRLQLNPGYVFYDDPSFDAFSADDVVGIYATEIGVVLSTGFGAFLGYATDVFSSQAFGRFDTELDAATLYLRGRWHADVPRAAWLRPYIALSGGASFVDLRVTDGGETFRDTTWAAMFESSVGLELAFPLDRNFMVGISNEYGWEYRTDMRFDRVQSDEGTSFRMGDVHLSGFRSRFGLFAAWLL